MARHLRNPEQTGSTRHRLPNGDIVVIPKEGYYFSDDASMDSAVDYLSSIGYEIVGTVVKEEPVKAKSPAKKKPSKQTQTPSEDGI